MRKKADARSTEDIMEEVGRLLFEEEQVTKAADLLSALEARPLTSEQQWEAQLLRGWVHERRGEHDQGRACARAVLTETSVPRTMGRAHHLLGTLTEARRLNRPTTDHDAIEESLLQYRLAIDLLEGYPEQLEVIELTAHLLLDINRDDEAIDLMEGAARRTWPATELLGTLEARLGEAYTVARHDWANGKQWLEQAAAILDPIAGWHSWVHSQLAQCYNMLKDYDQAARHAKRALELAARDKGGQPSDAIPAHREYAFALLSGVDDNRLAEKHVRRALALARGDVEMTAQLQARLGDCLRRQGRWREALQLFEQAMAADEHMANVSWVLMWAGCACAKLQDYDAAVDYLRRSLAVPQDEAEDPIRTYLYLGQCLFVLKRYREAGEALRAGLRLAPPNHRDQSDLRKWLLAANEHAARS